MSQDNAPQRPGILKQDSDYDPGCASPSSYLGLGYAYSPKTTPKSVSIAPNAETISPLVIGKQKPSSDDFFSNLDSEQRSPRKPSVKGPMAHRLARRPSINPAPSSSYSMDGAVHSDDRQFGEPHGPKQDHFMDEISAWIRDEKEKHAKRKAKRADRKGKRGLAATEAAQQAELQAATKDHETDESEEDLDLSKLEEIIKRTASMEVSHSRKHSLRHKIPHLSLKKLHKRNKSGGGSSDTEYLDGDALVPSCDAILDNSKTVAHTGGASDMSEDDDLKTMASYRDFDAWASFKYEIVRLTHTLRLKGWRRVPMDLSDKITVERLSGALTNAVYVVSPPDELPPRPDSRQSKGGAPPAPKKAPAKLLLRIYGPQVEHLIDRDSELQILRRLARKRIGPRMLGTFGNGRFEEYFHARALTAEEFRNPDTSRQIAKRMRELHEGIELLDKERNDGPFVWLNWDKWLQRVEQVVCWLDNEVKSMKPGVKPTGDEAWKRRGLICGVEWKQFHAAVVKYRKWLEDQYGGAGKISEELVFAHNDTQYGNILRLMPTEESPLMLPANSHKQLIVIDFEYANANLTGLEFANHFTEWCYNYHDEKKPYACNTNRYPTPEEQDRFLRAYVRHRPQFNVSTPKMSAQQSPAISSTSSTPKRNASTISEFMLDVRNPKNPTQPIKYDESAEKATEDAEVKRLLHETRIWRLANTAQWVAWGIVQAKVPRMPDFSPTAATTPEATSDHSEDDEEYKALARQETEASAAEEVEEEHEEFDYLGYAQHRAMFFWGDMLQLGIVRVEELPEALREKVKTVPY